jgi:hypothetical protein
MPIGLGLLWIGADRVVAKATTDVGVEIVSVHRLSKEGA